jgi:hypothetical protein
VNAAGRDGLGLKGQIAVGTDDAKTIALQLLLAARSDETGNVATGLRKPRSKEATHRTGTDNKNLHEDRSSYYLEIGCLLAARGRIFIVAICSAVQAS